MKKYIVLLFLIINSSIAFSQTQKTNFFAKKDKFEKKFLVGFAFNNSWTTFENIENINTFTKPSLGFHIKAEYWILKNVGIHAGAGIQQRGTGILVEDNNPNDPNMTYRRRFRTGNYSFPMQVLFRPNFEIFDQAKLNIGVGVVPTYMYKATIVDLSIEDGFHTNTDNLDSYKKFDMPFRLSAGIDFNAGNSALLRLEFNYDIGRNDLYLQSGTYSGKNKLIGIEVNCLF